MEPVTWRVPYEQHRLAAYSVSGGNPDLPQCILLHGGGAANKERVFPIARSLAGHGYSSHAFDAVGHGETGGALATTSLRSRSSQAHCFLKASGATKVVLIGVSMGGYTALDLVLRHGVSAAAVVLIAPAVYSDDAYAVPFGPAFTAVLRKENSWLETPLWSMLESYTGSVHVIVGDQDQVIPKPIPPKLVEAAGRRGHAELTVLKGVPHQISGKMCADSVFASAVCDKIAKRLPGAPISV